MHYNIPTMHWQRKSFTFKVECWSTPQDLCRSTPDPQVNPNFTFKVECRSNPPQDQYRSTPDLQVNPNFTFKVSVDRPPPRISVDPPQIRKLIPTSLSKWVLIDPPSPPLPPHLRIDNFKSWMSINPPLQTQTLESLLYDDTHTTCKCSQMMKILPL